MTGYTFNQLFDFTRTTSGTFVGSNGILQTTPASVNLLTYTQEFNNAAWATVNCAITANTVVAPDGTSTADTLTPSVGTVWPQLVSVVASTVTSAVYMASYFVRPGTHTFVQLAVSSQAADWCNFTLTGSGSVQNNGTAVGAISFDSATGYYRVSMTYTAGSTNRTPVISLVPSGTASRGQTGTYTGTETVFVWGAQLELGSTLTTYTRNNGGVYPARFDYDPVTLAPKGILIEEQRTNLLAYSEDFTNAAWVINGSPVITANAAVAPDGTSTADTMAVSGSSNGFGVYRNVVSSGTYTSSIYFKLVSGAFSLRVGLTSNFSVINCSTLAITNTGTGVGSVSAVGNGWYRFVSVGTISVLSASEFYNIGSNTGTLAIWGAQLEAGAFATSYIPTVASQVTRTADVCTISAPMFAPWYRQDEGTWAFDFGPFNFSGTIAGVAPYDAAIGAVTNGVRNGRQFSAQNQFGWVVVNKTSTPTGSAQIAGSAALAPLNGPAVAQKLAAFQSPNAIGGVVNGGAVTTTTLSSAPTGTADLFYINPLMNGHIRRITYYPFRASNNQLQALST